MTCKFSIIIPAYNVESYIEQCINSILIQDYDQYEVIIVNDGSTDRTGIICREYMEKNPKIRFLSYEKNRGASVARNKAMELAKGEYLLFIDSDDFWIEKSFLRILAEKLSIYPYDMVIYQMVNYYDKRKYFQKTKPDIEIIEGRNISQIYYSLVKDGQALAAVWNKCVKREIVEKNQIFFIENRIAEDIDWVLNLMNYIDSCGVLNLDVYAYRQEREGSITFETNKKSLRDLHFMIRKWYGKIQKGEVRHQSQTMGILAFEYAILLGYGHILPKRVRKKKIYPYSFLLKYALDKKSRWIYLFHKVFGSRFTELALYTFFYIRTMRSRW